MKALYGQQAQVLHAVRTLQRKDGKKQIGASSSSPFMGNRQFQISREIFDRLT